MNTAQWQRRASLGDIPTMKEMDRMRATTGTPSRALPAWAHLPTVRTSVTGWVTARLGTGPPSVWELAVIRC